jgi:hypothetical protein
LWGMDGGTTSKITSRTRECVIHLVMMKPLLSWAKSRRGGAAFAQPLYNAWKPFAQVLRSPLAGYAIEGNLVRYCLYALNVLIQRAAVVRLMCPRGFPLCDAAREIQEGLLGWVMRCTLISLSKPALVCLAHHGAYLGNHHQGTKSVCVLDYESQ